MHCLLQELCVRKACAPVAVNAWTTLLLLDRRGCGVQANVAETIPLHGLHFLGSSQRDQHPAVFTTFHTLHAKIPSFGTSCVTHCPLGNFSVLWNSFLYKTEVLDLLRKFHFVLSPAVPLYCTLYASEYEIRLSRDCDVTLVWVCVHWQSYVVSTTL